MKLRRNIVHVLVALLLVLSQQLGAIHAVSHISGYLHGTSEQAQDSDDSRTSRGGIALDQNCGQCLAFAQLATALDTPSFTFPAMSGCIFIPRRTAPAASASCLWCRAMR